VSVTAGTLAGALAGIVGADHVAEDATACAAAAIDGRRPRWVVRPGSLDETARVVALAHDERLTVVPRGAGTAPALGMPPARADVVLELARLDRIVEYNPDDLTVSVQAGVTAGALAAVLADRRQFLPLDPPGWGARTLGGIAATAAAGPLRARYGTIRDLLLGVRFVQADGVLTWGGSRVVKSVTGYDVPKLLVGSLGTLGLLGELTLRLHPRPEAEATCLLPLGSAELAQEVVARLVDSTLQPSRLELLDAGALAACALPRAAVALVISIGSVEPAVRAQQALLVSEAARVRAQVETMGPGFWRTYDRALAEAGPTVLRVSTLATRLAPTIAEIGAALDGHARIVTGCAPLGLLRVAIGDAEPARAAAAVERLRAFVAEADGSVVIERGSTALRALVDPWGPVPAGSLELMRALKTAMDPRATLNPGRFVGGL
jgi:glycolate oxidase FAD binding subunit